MLGKKSEAMADAKTCLELDSKYNCNKRKKVDRFSPSLSIGAKISTDFLHQRFYPTVDKVLQVSSFSKTKVLLTLDQKKKELSRVNVLLSALSLNFF